MGIHRPDAHVCANLRISHKVTQHEATHANKPRSWYLNVPAFHLLSAKFLQGPSSQCAPASVLAGTPCRAPHVGFLAFHASFFPFPSLHYWGYSQNKVPAQKPWSQALFLSLQHLAIIFQTWSSALSICGSSINLPGDEGLVQSFSRSSLGVFLKLP